MKLIQGQHLSVVLILKIAFFLLIAAVFVLLQVSAFKQFLMVPTFPLIVDTVLFFIFSSISISLLIRLQKNVDIIFSVNKYRFIKVIVLIIFFLLLAIGLNLFFISVFFPLYSLELSKTIEFKTIISLCYFVIAALFSLVVKIRNSINSDKDNGKLEIDQYSDMEYVDEERDLIERIAVKNGNKIDLIHISEIYYIQAYGDYVFIYTSKGRFVKEDTMKNLQRALPLSLFVRVHRSYIINVESIAKIERYGKQTFNITLKNESVIKASANGYKMLRNVLGI